MEEEKEKNKNEGVFVSSFYHLPIQLPFPSGTQYAQASSNKIETHKI